MQRASIAPPWTPAEINRLADLWRDGLSARQIAERLPGRSHNAVTARAKRDNLRPRPSPIQ